MDSKKTRRKIRYKLRILIYATLLSLILFSIVDYYSETAGLPDFIKSDIRSRFREKGLKLTFDNAKCGVINGLVLSNPHCSSGDLKIYPYISAVSMRLYPRLSFSSRYLISIDSITIKGGKAVFPLFPESGIEGGTDTLEFCDIDAMLVIDDKGLDVAWLTGNLWKLKVSIAGRIDHIFSQKVAGWFSASARKNTKKFDTASLMSGYSYQARALLWREYKDFSAKTQWGSGKPSCEIGFKLDPLNPSTNRLNLEFNTPAFTYASQKIEKGSATLSLKGDNLTLDQCIIKTPFGDKASISGILDTENAVATGKIDLFLTLRTFRSLIAVNQIEIPSGVELRSPISISAEIENHAIHSKSGRASFHLDIKKLKYGEASIDDLRIVGVAGDDSLSVSKGTFSIDGVRIKLALKCRPSSKSLDVDVHCFGPPVFVPKLIRTGSSGLIKDILNRFTFPKKNKDVDFTVQTHISWDGKLFYMATGNVVMRDFKYYKTKFTSGDSAFILDSNGLMFFHNMYLYQKNGWTKAALLYILTPTLRYSVESPFFKSDSGSQDKFSAEFKGSMSGDDLLYCIFPKWHSEMLDLSGLANLKAHGTIDFLDMEKTRFNVDVEKSSCIWNGVPISDLSYALRIKNLDMWINNVKGKVYGGNLTLDYSTNFKTSKGTVDLTLTDAEFPPLARKIEWKLSNGKGLINLTTDARLGKDESGKMTLYGKGAAKVRDANLWEVPVLRYFGKLGSKWTGGDWGVISGMTADFKFDGDHISTENIHTNGNVIALRGRGKYFWRTGDYNFIVNGEVFKSALPYKILSKIFLAKLLERRVVRKNGRTTLKKVKASDQKTKKSQ